VRVLDSWLDGACVQTNRLGVLKHAGGWVWWMVECTWAYFMSVVFALACLLIISRSVAGLLEGLRVLM
jgi:hypothetical protein